MTDILFLTLPRLELCPPLTAPAILKAVVELNGFTAFCLDLNLDLWNKLDETEFAYVWLDTDLTFRYEDKFNAFWDDQIVPHTADWVEQIRKKDPKWIGITLFSQRNKWMSIAMCKLIKEHFPDIKIIVGGPFAMYLGAPLLKHNLADFYVIGEGEEAIVNILTNNLPAPGVNGEPPVQINELDAIPGPDYSDSNMGDAVYITGSRGCVRRCAFCDIGDMWPKYKCRSGENIAAEIMTQYQKYNCTKFMFTDSLLNGSIPQLTDLCKTIISQNITGILLQGQFAARSEKDMPEEMYALMEQAGMQYVSIGVESGSEAVRNHMRKNVTDADLDFTFRMCAKYNIDMSWLLMVGYPTETEEDFQKTLDMLEKYCWINELGVVRNVALGPTMDIVPGSYIYDNQEKLGITWDKHNHWQLDSNTREVRIRRWLRLKDKCLELGYNIVEKATDHLLAELAIIEGKK